MPGTRHDDEVALPDVHSVAVARGGPRRGPNLRRTGRSRSGTETGGGCSGGRPGSGARPVRGPRRDSRWSQALPRMSRQRTSDGDARSRHRRPRVDLDRAPGRAGARRSCPPSHVSPASAPMTARAPTAPRHAEPKRPGGDAADGAGHRSRPPRPAAGGRRPPPLRAGRPLVWRHGRAPLRDEPSQGGRRAGLDRRSERGLRRRRRSGCCPRTCTRPQCSTHSPRRGW